MKLFISILLLSFSANSFAQVSLHWLKTVESPSQSGGSIAVDTIDNSSYAAAVGGSVTYLTKRNKAGKTLWSASASSAYLEGITKAFVDPQGNAVVTGFQYYSTINGMVVVGLLVREFSPSGTLRYSKIIPGFYTNVDGGDIEHPGNNQSKVTAAMDGTGAVYLATGGNVNGGGIGFNLVKISNSGNLAHTSTNNFGLDTTGSASPFYYVSNLTLHGNRAGLTGSSKIGFQNITTWVLDTAGTSLWADLSNGLGGNDLVMDNTYTSYVVGMNLNVAGGGTGDDIVLIKFNPSGNKLLTKGYDFGGDEIPKRILLSPNGKLVVMASGTGTSSLFFSDWLIVKLNLQGVVQWNYRYNKSNYDEQPRAVVQDKKSNVYVTGSGGPDTGDFLTGLYGVTLKLSSSGNLKWTSLIHLFNFTPVDLALGSDTSVFVISAPAATVAHLKQKSKSDSCAVPSNLQASSITMNSAVVSWNKVPDVFQYDLQYKTTTAAEWTQVSVDANKDTLSGLLQGTSYEFRVQAICAVGPSGFSESATFSTAGAGYCSSSASFNNPYFISWVELGSISKLSNSEGYGDFTNLSTDLKQGSTYTINTSAYVIGDFYNEWFSIWIDYNKDGDFTDSGELILQFKQTTTGYTAHSFTVPAAAVSGLTRMRISMKHGSYSTSCENFQNGEVEDYTINIVPQKLEAPTIENKVRVTVLPDPATELITVDFKGFTGKVFLKIYNTSGQLMWNEAYIEERNVQLEVVNFPKGVYLLELNDEAGTVQALKWIKQ